MPQSGARDLHLQRIASGGPPAPGPEPVRPGD
jgi:hypothetical protein